MFGLVPTEWAAVVGSVLTALILLRTALLAALTAVDALDLALDGKVDWLWPQRLANAIHRFDGWLDRLPVKAPVIRSR
jgi:hypothetical protein